MHETEQRRTEWHWSKIGFKTEWWMDTVNGSSRSKAATTMKKIKNVRFLSISLLPLDQHLPKNQITKANHRWSTNATRIHQMLRAMAGYRENPLLNINRIKIRICGFAICPPINNIYIFALTITLMCVCVCASHIVVARVKRLRFSNFTQIQIQPECLKIKRNRMEMNKFFENCIIKCSGISIC